MNNKREKIVPLIIFFAVLLVYIAFPTKNYYWDGIEFAQVIESAAALDTSLLHPNHLFYNVVGYAAYQFAHSVGFDVRAILVLQIVNSIFSAVSAVALFYILKASLRSNYLSAMLAFLFAFSALWWKFSTDANSYIPGVFFLIVSFYLLLPDKKPQPLLLALAHTAAMCFHQLAVFFFPVAVFGLYFQSVDQEKRTRFAAILQYGAAAFLFTFGLYCAAFYLQTGGFDVRFFSKWLTNYSPENGFLFNLKDCLKYTFGGQFKLFFGGRFGFLKEVLGPLTIALLGVLALCAAGLIIQIVRLRNADKAVEPRKSFEQNKRLAILCLVWAGIYLAFLFFWIPQNTFYRMFYLPAYIILIGILLNRFRQKDGIGWRAALFVAIAASANFLFYIYPYAQVRRETPLALATEMNKIWSPRTVVFYAKLESDNRLSKYFNPATRWIKLDAGVSREAFESEVRKIYSEGGEVWLETWAIDQFAAQPQFAAWLAEHRREQYRVNDPSYRVVFVKVVP